MLYWIPILLFISWVPFSYLLYTGHDSFGQDDQVKPIIKEPVVKDNNLRVEVIAQGLSVPTTMAFLGPDNILVLEKNNGTVRNIVNGVLVPQPLLDVHVASDNERGMVGIAIPNKQVGNNSTYVFIYYTEARIQDGEDDCPKPSYCNEWNEPLGNRLYRYELVNNKLVNPKLLLNLPLSPGSVHIGGAMTIGPDDYIYLPVGDMSLPETLASNSDGRFPLNGSGGILRIAQNGSLIKTAPILNNSYPLNLYYSYGIRNSFGIDFDPLTGKLWDTENGPGYGDEINLVEPGFNSGWKIVQGIWIARDYLGGEMVLKEPNSLVTFNGKGNYSLPELTWSRAVAPTAIKFFDSDKFGKEYENDLFVATLIPNGDIYHFDLSNNRTELLLNNSLEDKIVNSLEEAEPVIFGKEFGGISDLEVGPDGYLYVLSFAEGKLYRITPLNKT
jgi:glucose/arabinose dehydrogenase